MSLLLAVSQKKLPRSGLSVIKCFARNLQIFVLSLGVWDSWLKKLGSDKHSSLLQMLLI
jgi:hypothetical protein